jgi:hypothetical protein
MIMEEHEMKQQATVLMFLTRCIEQGDDFLSRIVMGQDIGLAHKPRIKAAVHEVEAHIIGNKEKIQQAISTRKIMRTVFWDRNHVQLVEFLPQGSTVSPGVYCNILKKLCHAIENKRHGMLQWGVIMLHDNACPHTASTVQYLIVIFRWEKYDNLSYSPDLAPSDFHVF